MEGLLANTHELKGKMKEKVEANKELGLLSKDLATIILDVPVEFNFDDFEMSQPDIQGVTSIFQELEFRRLIDNFTKTFAPKVETTTTQSPTKEKEIVEIKKPAQGNSQLDLFAVPTATKEPEIITGFRESKNTNHFYQYVNNDLSRRILLKKLLAQKRFVLIPKQRV